MAVTGRRGKDADADADAGAGAGADAGADAGALTVRASLRLLALRVVVLVLASAPALIAGVVAMAHGAARRPYYTDVEGRLPLIHLARLANDLPPSLLPAAIVSIVLSLLADQVLTGGALALVGPDRSADAPVRVLDAVGREGLTHLWAFLRIALLGLVISGAGIALIQRLFTRLDTVGYRSGWTGETVNATLPLLSAVASLLWLATSGAWVFWSRLVTAADGRRKVRRTGLLALRVLWRSPLRAFGLFIALTLAPTLLSGAVLVAWRQAEPGSTAGALLWSVGWLATVGVQSFTWLWLLHAGRRLYGGDRFADLRSRPDEPYRPLDILKRWWPWKASPG